MIGTTWFRLEDRSYSIADEYGEHYATSYDVAVLTFVVVKRTPKGVQLRQYWGTQPEPSQIKGPCRFVLDAANKRFACPSLPEAIESYLARKDKQIRIYSNRIKVAEKYKSIAEQLKLKKGVPA